MTDLQIFNNPNFGQVRTVEDNGKVLFCGSDVAKALGYARPADAITSHCKGVSVLPTPTNGGIQQVKYIPEGDLYRLIVNSKLPTAVKFERWVFDDVLPSIRKHGMYAKDELLDNPDLFIRVLQDLKDERNLRNRLQNRVEQQNQVIGELKPKADYTDRILQSKSLVAATQIAKDYGMSGQAFNKLLHNLGVQYSACGQWLLYSKYQACGYTSSETIEFTRSSGILDTKMQTKFTQKGRLFIYELLKKNNVLPVIER